MYVGIAKLTLAISEAHSLKEKRMVIRRIKDRVRERLSVTVNEVGELDVWQRAELGFSVVSGERAKAGDMLDEVVRVASQAGADDGAELVGIAKDVTTFDAPVEPVASKATGADDWVPEEWKS